MTTMLPCRPWLDTTTMPNTWRSWRMQSTKQIQVSLGFRINSLSIRVWSALKCSNRLVKDRAASMSMAGISMWAVKWWRAFGPKTERQPLNTALPSGDRIAIIKVLGQRFSAIPVEISRIIRTIRQPIVHPAIVQIETAQIVAIDASLIQ